MIVLCSVECWMLHSHCGQYSLGRMWMTFHPFYWLRFLFSVGTLCKVSKATKNKLKICNSHASRDECEWTNGHGSTLNSTAMLAHKIVNAFIIRSIYQLDMYGGEKKKNVHTISIHQDFVRSTANQPNDLVNVSHLIRILRSLSIFFSQQPHFTFSRSRCRRLIPLRSNASRVPFHVYSVITNSQDRLKWFRLYGLFSKFFFPRPRISTV